MAQTWLPGDTRQRIQDLIKDISITQAELAGIRLQSTLMYPQTSFWERPTSQIVRTMISKNWGFPQNPRNYCIPERSIPAS